MSRQEMIKAHWKPYMLVVYQDRGMKFPAECLLSGIDFDSELLTLTPLDGLHEEHEFTGHIQFCSIPKRMKAISVNGKKVSDPIENHIKGRKYP